MKTAALIIRYLFLVQLACAVVAPFVLEGESAIAVWAGVLFWGGLALVLARGAAEEEQKELAREAREDWLRAKGRGGDGGYGQVRRDEAARRKNHGEGEPEI